MRVAAHMPHDYELVIRAGERPTMPAPRTPDVLRRAA
jgi:hypothetical protein